MPTWPLLFRLLATTSSSYIRFAGDCVLVWAAYALPTFLAQWPGTLFCYRSLGRGDVWAAGCVAWFYVLVAVNVKLFSARPRTRLGRRPPTRAVSSIRSPRGDGVGPELTFSRRCRRLHRERSPHPHHIPSSGDVSGTIYCVRTSHPSIHNSLPEHVFHAPLAGSGRVVTKMDTSPRSSGTGFVRPSPVR